MAERIFDEPYKNNIEHIEQLALNQYDHKGSIDEGVLDLIIEDRQINIDGFKDKDRAREMWRNLITLSLIDPAAYEDVLEHIENTAKELGCKNNIPDIVA